MIKILNLKLVVLIVILIAILISKYKNIFAKGYIPNWSDQVFVIKKVKNTVPWTYLLVILKAKKLLKRFTKKHSKKQIKKSLDLKK